MADVLSLTLGDAVQLYKDAKPSRFKDADEAIMIKKIHEYFSIDDDVNLKKGSDELFDNLYRRCQLLIKRKTNFEPSEVAMMKNSLVVIHRLPATPEAPAPKVSKLTPLNELSDRQLQRRSGEVKETIKMLAEEQNTSPTKMMSIASRKINYVHNREKCADSIKMKKDWIPVAAAAHLVVYNNLSKAAYQRQINLYKVNKKDINPPWKQVREFQKAITPNLSHLPDNLGVKCEYKDALTITFKQIASTVSSTMPLNVDVDFYFKDGCDGSGSHSIYNQKGNHDTHNILLYMFTPLKILDSTTNDVIWRETKPNSPHSTRPLMLFLGKETYDNMQMPMAIQKEKESLTAAGPLQVEIETPEGRRTCKINLKGRFSMLDGKFRKLVSGLGGAWCLLCTANRNEVSGFVPEDEESDDEDSSVEEEMDENPPNLIDEDGSSSDSADEEGGEAEGNDEDESEPEDEDVASGLRRMMTGFPINRSMEQTQKIYDQILSGLISQKAASADRLGVTQAPMLKEEILIISSLHVMLRLFDFIVKLIVLLRAGIYRWSDTKSVLGNRYRFFVKAKQDLIDTVKRECHTTIEVPDSAGKGGTSTNGNDVQRLLGSLKGRKVLASLVPARYQDDMYDVLCRLYAIGKMYNSSEQVSTYYEEFCMETAEKILTKFRSGDKKLWIYFSPTVHSLLHHSYELIEANEGQGMLEYSESPLEANHKFMRFYRQFLARKTSQPENLTDVFNRFWHKSDIVIKLAGEKIVKQKIQDDQVQDVIGPLECFDMYWQQLKE